MYSTSARVTIERMRKIFATYGVPRRVESDGGPPFKSEEFAAYAQEAGFTHHIVTPE